MRLAAALAVFLVTPTAAAAVHVVTPTTPDGASKISGAASGDVVLIAPGTYSFRVHLYQMATKEKPIVIRALDPKNPPVFDYTSKMMEDWPGSGSFSAGCWHVSGWFLEVDDIIVKGCRSTKYLGAGFGIAKAKYLLLRGITVRDSDAGVSGEGFEIDVEHADIGFNGRAGTPPTDNITMAGETFHLRWSYVHDATHGRNFTVSARVSTFEYDWFARAKLNEGHLDGLPFDGFDRRANILGSVIVQHDTPTDPTRILSVMRGVSASIQTKLEVISSTIVAKSTTTAAVQLETNAFASANLTLSNTVIVGTNTPYALTNPPTASVVGKNDWLPTGATPTTGLTGVIFGASPSLDARYRPIVGSPLIGKAEPTVVPKPTSEYFEDELVIRMKRARTSMLDIGAFESTTTGPGVTYDLPMIDAGIPEAGPTDAGADARVDATTLDATTSDTTASDSAVSDTAASDSAAEDVGGAAPIPTESSGGCGCRVADTRENGYVALFAVGVAAAVVTRRKRARC